MHTTQALDENDIQYQVDGQSVSRSDVMPDITPLDRVGVAMGSGTDGIGAGNFILSCVTAFYDQLRQTKEDFFEYPDFYTFQVTADLADYRMLDIYPDHKNVRVDAEAEELLRAINDRAINILLVPEVPTGVPDIDDVTRRSAERRITHCYLYAPDGHPTDAKFSIHQPRNPTEDWYQKTVESVATTTNSSTNPSIESEDSHIRQEFRQIPVDEALSRLPTPRNSEN